MKKIGLISLALVMALGGLGIGYARWSDTLYIDGTVSTASVCIEWIAPATSLDPPDLTPPYENYDWTADPGTIANRHVYGTQAGENDSKDVGSTTVTIVPAAHPDTIEVVLENVYPSYYNNITVHMQNCGTLPIRLRQQTLTYPDPWIPGQFITVPLTFSQVVNIWGPDQYDTISPVIEIKWVTRATGVQLHPGEEMEESWHIHILQAAMQDTTYTFTITQEAVQWNEYE